mgnify:FL=1
MEPPRKAQDEAFRLDTLHSLRLLDTAAEERFDRLTRIARRLLDTPWAMLTLVDEHRLWVKSSAGLEISEIPREFSFCGHAIVDEDDILVIPDTHSDDRFADNPFVVDLPGIRAYAGCPVSAGNGNRMGTLCVCAPETRDFSGEERMLLRDLANVAERELDVPRAGTLDALTGVSDPQSFYALSRQALTFCERFGHPATLVFFRLGEGDLDSPIHGHARADRLLAGFADTLLDYSRERDVRGRVDADEFALLLPNCDRDRVELVLERIRSGMAAGADAGGPQFHAASVEYDPERHDDVKQLVDEAAWSLHQQLHPAPAPDKSDMKPVY